MRIINYILTSLVIFLLLSIIFATEDIEQLSTSRALGTLVFIHGLIGISSIWKNTNE
jgi:hypothetical protein